MQTRTRRRPALEVGLGRDQLGWALTTVLVLLTVALWTWLAAGAA